MFTTTNTTNIATSLEFGQAFSDMLFRRLDNQSILGLLTESDIYRDAQQEYDDAYEAVFDAKGAASRGNVQELIDALRRLHDLETNYIYRTGIQNGLLLMTPGFRTIGVE